MVPIRVLFLALIVVTVVTLTNGSSPTKLGDKLKSIAHNEKFKAKVKVFNDHHPKIAKREKNIMNKLVKLAMSAAESKQGVKVRGLTKSTSMKVKNNFDSVKKNFVNVKNKASNVHSKLLGHNNNSDKRGVTNLDILKHAIGSGSSNLSKLSQLTNLKAFKTKASDKLKVITDSQLVKQSKDTFTKLKLKKTKTG